MGDSENALPPSKKRAAGRELTRDTPLDDEEDSPELDAGTFKRASDEVLATRRIVKVRRQQTNSAPSNPFARIRLVTPTESGANPGEATTETQKAGENTIAGDSKGSESETKESEKAKDEAGKQPETETESKTHEVEDKSGANKDAAEGSNADKEHAEKENKGDKSEVDDKQSKDGDKSENVDKKEAADKESANEVDKEQSKDDNNTENDDKKENSENKDKKEDKVESEVPITEGGENSENKDKKDDKVDSEEPSAEGGSLKSFQQLSQSQNAFTGLAGTGFSSSLFSSGSMSNDGSSLGSRSGSIFGMKNDKPFGLGLSTNGSSGFGASAISKSDGSGLPTLKEVVVETGEENEKVVFNADSILFEFVDGSWKERGKGELKVNVSSETAKGRLLMRSRGNYRLILNARLYPDMKLTNMDKKGVTFACMNSATEVKDGLSTFALKFKDGSTVEDFKAAITAHKGEASTGLKTPENSPKASDA